MKHVILMPDKDRQVEHISVSGDGSITGLRVGLYFHYAKIDMEPGEVVTLGVGVKFGPGEMITVYSNGNEFLNAEIVYSETKRRKKR